jgi:hypothetical protein
MANEISYNLQVSISNGTYKDSFTKLGAFITQNAQGAAGGIQTVGTTEENLVITDSVTTNGCIVLHNLDSTNFVDYGLDDAGTMKAIGRIKPGEAHWLRLKPSTNLRMKADTAAVRVEYLLLND